jgi:hypothetical protein
MDVQSSQENLLTEETLPKTAHRETTSEHGYTEDFSFPPAYPVTKDKWQEYFKNSKSPNNRVDHIIEVLRTCERALSDISCKVEHYKNLETRWETTKESLEKYVTWLLTNKPSHQNAGTSFRLESKPAPKPRVRSSVRTSFTAHNVIVDELVHTIPEKYRKSKVLWFLNEGLIRDDLLLRKGLHFAELLYKQLVLIKPKEKKTLSKKDLKGPTH